MRSPAVVYRTTDAETIAQYRAAHDARREWGERLVDWVHSIIPKGDALTSTGMGREAFVGIRYEHGMDVPDGWRVQRARRGWDYLVPRRSTKAGKAIAKVFDSFGRAPSVRDAVRDMPGGFFGGAEDGRGGMAWHSMGVDLEGDSLTVCWGVELPDGEAEKVGPQWERVPLSQWWAEREALEKSS